MHGLRQHTKLQFQQCGSRTGPRKTKDGNSTVSFPDDLDRWFTDGASIKPGTTSFRRCTRRDQLPIRPLVESFGNNTERPCRVDGSRHELYPDSVVPKGEFRDLCASIDFDVEIRCGKEPAGLTTDKCHVTSPGPIRTTETGRGGQTTNKREEKCHVTSPGPIRTTETGRGAAIVTNRKRNKENHQTVGEQIGKVVTEERQTGKKVRFQLPDGADSDWTQPDLTDLITEDTEIYRSWLRLGIDQLAEDDDWPGSLQLTQNTR